MNYIGLQFLFTGGSFARFVVTQEVAKHVINTWTANRFADGTVIGDNNQFGAWGVRMGPHVVAVHTVPVEQQQQAQGHPYPHKGMSGLN